MEDDLILDQDQRTKAVVVSDLPGAGGVLAMGIISIVFCMGLIGIILSIIVLTRSHKLKTMYEMEPSAYTERSYKQMNAGKICSIVSLSLFGLILLLVLAVQ